MSTHNLSFFLILEFDTTTSNTLIVLDTSDEVTSESKVAVMRDVEVRIEERYRLRRTVLTRHLYEVNFQDGTTRIHRAQFGSERIKVGWDV